MINNLTINEAFKEYAEYIEIKLKAQSVRSIKSRFYSYILPYFNNKKIIDIKPIDYLKWQQEINNKNFKYGYKKQLHYTMSQLYSYLSLFYNYENNIPKKVGGFRDDSITEEMRFLEIDEFNSFINTFKNQDFVYKYFFDFLFYTGCRLGEANALTFNDLSEDTIYINKTLSKERANGQRVITSPKTRKSIRKIKIDKILIKEIEDLELFYKAKYDNFNKDFYIFGGIKPLAPTTITRKKNEYCDLAKIKRIRIHDFRHSHATLLLKHQIPIEEISHRLGHSDINMTINTYTHLTPTYEKRVLNTLNSLHKY